MSIHKERWLWLDQIKGISTSTSTSTYLDPQTTFYGSELMNIASTYASDNARRRGFAITSYGFIRFMARNSMVGLIEDMAESLDVLEPEVAGRIIDNHFAKARYCAEEVQALRQFYIESDKPLCLKVNLLNTARGQFIQELEPLEINNINSFEDLMNGLIQLWKDNIRPERLQTLKNLGVSSTCSALVWGFYDSESKYLQEQRDQLEHQTQFQALRTKAQQQTAYMRALEIDSNSSKSKIVESVKNTCRYFFKK